MIRSALLAASMFAAAAGTAPAVEDAKGEKVDFVVHSGHFEKNNSDLKGEQSFLAITDRAGFDKVFGAGFVMGKKPNVVGKNAFEKNLVVATITRGNAITKYEVEKVLLDKDGLLSVLYKATAEPPGTARFASPLIITVPKDKVKKVAFIENGKTVGTAEPK